MDGVRNTVDYSRNSRAFHRGERKVFAIYLIILAIFEAYPIERSFSYLRCCSSAVPLAFFVPDLPVIAAYVSSSC